MQRLKFIKKIDDKVSLFHPYEKRGKFSYVDENKEIPLETKFIYPYILSPHLTDEGLKWNEDKTYVIFPYIEGENSQFQEINYKKKHRYYLII